MPSVGGASAVVVTVGLSADGLVGTGVDHAAGTESVCGASSFSAEESYPLWEVKCLFLRPTCAVPEVLGQSSVPVFGAVSTGGSDFAGDLFRLFRSLCGEVGASCLFA